MLQTQIDNDIVEEVRLVFNETVTIEFSPVWCQITSNNSQELYEYLYNNLAYKPEGFYFSPKYQEGVWDGYSRLFKPITKRFRVGLLTKVIRLLEETDCTVVVSDFPHIELKQLKTTIYKNAKKENVELRHYQIDPVLTAIEKRFGIIQAPPRSGKTLISTAIIDNEDIYPTTFFVRSKDLAYQTLAVFKANFEDKKVGFICDGVCDIGDINVVTIQSVFSAYNKKCGEKGLTKEKEIDNKTEVKKLIRLTERVFYDEAHHTSSDTSKFILDHCVSATMKIGLSATPFSEKEESVLVEESLGPVIYQISYSELIKEGFLMKPYIYMYKLPKLELEGVYRSIYKQAVVENQFLTTLIGSIVKKLNSLGKSVVIQTESVSHSKNLAKYLSCEYLIGSDSTEKRQRVIQDLLNKKILCVVSTLFEEGLDTVTLDYTINLAGGLSNISTFQRMRSITAHESKTTIGIIDFIHQCKYLKRHSKKRMELYSSEPEFVIETRDVSKLGVQDLIF